MATESFEGQKGDARTVSKANRPSKEQIAGMLKHVYYEIDQILCIPKHDPEDKRILESVYFALQVHGRVLLDFFQNDAANRQRDDVVCSDFRFDARPVDVGDDNEERLNKDLVHLTYSRLRHKPETQRWPVWEFIVPLRNRAAEFISHIVRNPPEGTPPDEIEDWKALQQALLRTDKSVVEANVTSGGMGPGNRAQTSVGAGSLGNNTARVRATGGGATPQ